MDREQIAQDVCNKCRLSGICQEVKQPCSNAYEDADEYIELFESLGYRRIPELKVLSDYKIKAIKESDYPVTDAHSLERAVAQAQLDEIKKQLEVSHD